LDRLGRSSPCPIGPEIALSPSAIKEAGNGRIEGFHPINDLILLVLGNSLRREGSPKRVSKVHKLSKDSLFKLLHVGHEFITYPI